ncbi:empty spiracles homeobox 3 [Neosynchiropus ocellatus]
MFGVTNKSFSIESLIGTELDRCAGSRNNLIRPTALRFPGSPPPSGLFGSVAQEGSRSGVVLQDCRMQPHRRDCLSLHPLGAPGPSFFGPESWDFMAPWRLLGPQFKDNGPVQENLLLHSTSLSRKPKRIRTTFSPSQLVQLEQAFEQTHYVVGSARRHLANGLCLTETQVKVWFQNRRTKHKRQKCEEESRELKKPDGPHTIYWKAATCQRQREANNIGEGVEARQRKKHTLDQN